MTVSDVGFVPSGLDLVVKKCMQTNSHNVSRHGFRANSLFFEDEFVSDGGFAVFHAYLAEQGTMRIRGCGPSTVTGVTLVNSVSLPAPPLTSAFAASSISNLLLIPGDALV